MLSTFTPVTFTSLYLSAQEHKNKAAKAAGKAVELRCLDDRSDECEAAAQKNRDLTTGNQMENQSAESRSEKCHCRIKADQEWNQNRGTERHEQKLDADDRASE